MPRQRFTGFVDARHQRIFADSWLHLPAYDCDIPEWLLQSYVWRVVGFSRRCLKLEAYGIPAAVELVHEVCRHVEVFYPSPRVRLSDYPEEWGWWQNAGWNILVEHGRAGGVWLRGHKHNTWLSHDIPAEVVADPEAVRQYLQHALYLELHPVKGRRHKEQGGIPDTEVESMVRRLRQQDSGHEPKARAPRKKE